MSPIAIQIQGLLTGTCMQNGLKTPSFLLQDGASTHISSELINLAISNDRL